MKIDRTKNAKRNIISGILLKIYQIIPPFIMRTAMIYFMGVQYLGLNSLFTSILQVLNLAELGIGSAMVFSMYKPIAEDDDETICALMKLYKIYYRGIGVIIAIVGVLLTPFIPYLVKSDIPNDISIHVLYLLNLAGTVLSYWLFAYKNSILQAYQRTDIVSKVILITSTIQNLLQFFVLWFLRNYYCYVIVALFTQALTNILTAVAANKLFPQYYARGELPKDVIKGINRRIRDLFTSKIGMIVVNSADSIVISAFLGLTVLAIYQNYFFVLTSVIGFVTVIFNACTAGIGNSLVTETEEKNFHDLKVFTFLIAWIAGLCGTYLLCLYQPFMIIWVGDGLCLEMSAVVAFCVYYYIYEINQLLNLYKDAAGIWHEDRFRPLVTAVSNLVLNLIMVQFWGIYGIILSTVMSMLFIGMPWLIKNLFNTIFESQNMIGYTKKLVSYTLISVITASITYGLCSLIITGTVATLLIRFCICTFLPNIMFYYCYRGKQEFKAAVEIADRITNGNMKLTKRLVRG